METHLVLYTQWLVFLQRLQLTISRFVKFSCTCMHLTLCSEIHCTILSTKCYGIYLAENCCFSLVELIQRGLSPQHLLLHHQQSSSEANNIPEQQVGKLTLRLTWLSWSTLILSSSATFFIFGNGKNETKLRLEVKKKKTIVPQ